MASRSPKKRGGTAYRPACQCIGIGAGTNRDVTNLGGAPETIPATIAAEVARG